MFESREAATESQQEFSIETRRLPQVPSPMLLPLKARLQGKMPELA